MRSRRFAQVDVFGGEPYLGNPVAVVLDGEGLDEGQMRRFARWTNLSETTFVLPPTAPGADYRVRIFTATVELPFAGHPTLGTCRAWADATGATGERFVQECGAGLVEIRRTSGGLAFAGPPLVRSGDLSPEELDAIVHVLGIAREEVVDAQWVDNGPGWAGVLLESADRVLSLEPAPSRHRIGVVGPHGPGAEAAVEVRGFFEDWEDPVTGSLQASLGEWLLRSGRLTAPYVARQGTAVERRGLVHVSRDADGTIWVAGTTEISVSGTVML